jgi:streptogramin lyase
MTCPTNSKTVECGTNWWFDAPTNILDNCCTNYSLTFSAVTNSGPCPLVITGTWLVSDTCGNSNTCSQTVTVVNTTPPIFTNCPASTNLGCNPVSIPGIDPNVRAINGCGSATIPSYLLVSSLNNNQVKRYDAATGAFIDTFASGGGLNGPEGLVLGPDGNLYVCSFFSNEVKRYNGTTGAFIDTFVSAGSSGLNGPAGLAFGPDGNLYVSSAYTSDVKRYNGTTGAFMGSFVSAGSGGLNGPVGLVFGPDGNLYVSSSGTAEVKRYNGTTGAFINTFASGNGLSLPYGLVFGRDGNLYVSSLGNNLVKRFNGTTGAFIDTFVSGGGLSLPYGLVFGPDGNLYLCSEGTSDVKRYNGSGALLGSFVSTGSGGLNGSTFLIFTASGPVITSAQVDTTNGCAHTRTITYTAVDSCGNSNTCTQVITWTVDTTPPVIQGATNIMVQSCTSVAVTYPVTVTDNCCSNASVVFTPTNGTMFAPGTTNNVHCVATDCCGNTNSCDFTVTVQCQSSLTLSWPTNGNTLTLTWPTNTGVPYWWLQSATNLNAGSFWETYFWATNPPIFVPMTNTERYFRLFHTNYGQ